MKQTGMNYSVSLGKEVENYFHALRDDIPITACSVSLRVAATNDPVWEQNNQSRSFSSKTGAEVADKAHGPTLTKPTCTNPPMHAHCA